MMYIIISLISIIFLVMLFILIKVIKRKKKDRELMILSHSPLDNLNNEIEPLIVGYDDFGKRIYLNYSYEAKLYQYPTHLKILYNELKILLLKFYGIKYIKTWTHERFFLNDHEILKISLDEHYIKLFLSFNDHKNNLNTNCVILNDKFHENTPYLFLIDSRLSLNQVLQIIRNELLTKTTILEHHSKVKFYPYKDTKKLIKKKLIKVSY